MAVAVAFLATCGGTSTAPPAAPSTSASAQASPGLPRSHRPYPPFGDVPFYRVDDHGQVVEPGPGPSDVPTLVWNQPIGSTHWGAILVAGVLYTIGVSTGTVVALDARTGAQHWQFQVTAGSPGANGAAAASDGLVFVSDPKMVYALDATTGAQRWATAVPNEYERPVVVDGVLYVGMVGGAEGLDVHTGEVVWHWAGPDTVAFSMGLVADGTAYISSLEDGRLYAINLSDSREVWHVQTIGAVVSSSAIVGDTIYAGTVQAGAPQPVGELYAIDRTDGVIRWRFQTPTGVQILPGPARDGVLYAGSLGDGIYAFRDDGEVGSQLWHADSPAASVPISLQAGTLYEQRVDGSIGAYAAADGHLEWQTDATGSDGGGPPLVSGGMVFAVSDASGVMAFGDP
jgi:outer membrane protein assembly factor BamB